jgi:hypothetical protein
MQGIGSPQTEPMLVGKTSRRPEMLSVHGSYIQ